MVAQDAAYAVNEQVAVFNPALGYLANSEVNAEVGTDIEQIIEDARTQSICGQIDEAGLDAAGQQWLDRGGDRLVGEINELYQNDKRHRKIRNTGKRFQTCQTDWSHLSAKAR
ncbi:MAG: hypothetical protein WCD89_20075 [Anaerocolumna sp.]